MPGKVKSRAFIVKANDVNGKPHQLAISGSDSFYVRTPLWNGRTIQDILFEYFIKGKKVNSGRLRNVLSKRNKMTPIGKSVVETAMNRIQQAAKKNEEYHGLVFNKLSHGGNRSGSNDFGKVISRAQDNYLIRLLKRSIEKKEFNLEAIRIRFNEAGKRYFGRTFSNRNGLDDIIYIRIYDLWNKATAGKKKEYQSALKELEKIHSKRRLTVMIRRRKGMKSKDSNEL